MVVSFEHFRHLGGLQQNQQQQSTEVPTNVIIFGDEMALTTFIKYVILVVCFMIVFISYLFLYAIVFLFLNACMVLTNIYCLIQELMSLLHTQDTKGLTIEIHIII